jgi:adsorption protein B
MVVREALAQANPSAASAAPSPATQWPARRARSGRQSVRCRSLTEDYEIGLKLHALGRRAAFVRLPATPGGTVIVKPGALSVRLAGGGESDARDG